MGGGGGCYNFSLMLARKTPVIHYFRHHDAHVIHLNDSSNIKGSHGPDMNICMSGPCITNVIATCRKNFSQWERSFLWKLRCHWLKFLRHVAKTLVIQGPGASAGCCYNTTHPDAASDDKFVTTSCADSEDKHCILAIATFHELLLSSKICRPVYFCWFFLRFNHRHIA